MVGTLGLRLMNLAAVAVNIIITVTALILSAWGLSLHRDKSGSSAAAGAGPIEATLPDDVESRRLAESCC